MWKPDRLAGSGKSLLAIASTVIFGSGPWGTHNHIFLFHIWKPDLIDCLIAKLLLALASTVILDSESRGACDLILLSNGSGSLQSDSDLMFI
jgi:hypothetical protein